MDKRVVEELYPRKGGDGHRKLEVNGYGGPKAKSS